MRKYKITESTINNAIKSALNEYFFFPQSEQDNDEPESHDRVKECVWDIRNALTQANNSFYDLYNIGDSELKTTVRQVHTEFAKFAKNYQKNIEMPILGDEAPDDYDMEI